MNQSANRVEIVIKDLLGLGPLVKLRRIEFTFRVAIERPRLVGWRLRLLGGG